MSLIEELQDVMSLKQPVWLWSPLKLFPQALIKWQKLYKFISEATQWRAILICFVSPGFLTRSLSQCFNKKCFKPQMQKKLNIQKTQRHQEPFFDKQTVWTLEPPLKVKHWTVSPRRAPFWFTAISAIPRKPCDSHWNL